MSKSCSPSHGFRTREYVYQSSVFETEIDDSSRIFVERCPIISVDTNIDMVVVYSQWLEAEAHGFNHIWEKS